MNRLLLISVTILLANSATAVAGSLPPNGGFESGDFSGWSSIGDASIATSLIGTAPSEGSYQAFLTTTSDFGDFNNFSGSDAAPVMTIESFLGLPNGSLGSGYEGSAIRTTFSGNAGDLLQFDFNFLTTETTVPDFAFVTLVSTAFLTDALSATLTPSAVPLDPIFLVDTTETGYLTYSIVLPASGPFTLGIGVLDDNDEFNPSALLVDNVRLTAVPEPASLSLILVGGLAVLGRRFRLGMLNLCSRSI
jgi:hypothetical protein